MIERNGPGRRDNDTIRELTEEGSLAAALAAVHASERAVKHADQTDDRSRRILWIVLGLVALNVAAIMVGGFFIAANTMSITTNQHKAEARARAVQVAAITEARRVQASTRAAALGASRISCEVGNVVRAELHLSAQAVAGDPLLVIRRRRIPITECGPILSGGQRVPLSRREQVRFEQYFRVNGRVPLTRDGRVLDVPNPRVPLGR